MPGRRRLVALNPKEREALKFLATHLVYGLVAAFTFGGAVLGTNLSNLRTLALESAHPVIVLILFFFGLCITFGSVGMGVGIMSLARDEDSE